MKCPSCGSELEEQRRSDNVVALVCPDDCTRRPGLIKRIKEVLR